MAFLPAQYLIPLSYERIWSKRDAFILMDCDSEKYTDTLQCLATFILLKKAPDSIALIDEYLKYAQDPRIITDMPNQMGKENYAEFKENRHDQTIWSLLIKKHNIKTFRDPSHFSDLCPSDNHPKDVLERSTYPTIFYHHRRSVGFDRTIGDFLRIYANEPNLNEGFRTAKYLIKEGMVKEAYKILKRLLEKYQDGNDEAWSNIWNDLLYITFKHQDMGAPHAKDFLPLLCNLFLQIMRREVKLIHLPPLIFAAKYVLKYIRNKNLIPKEFLDRLAYLVECYVRQTADMQLMAFMAKPQELLNYYRELNLPETPFLKNIS